MFSFQVFPDRISHKLQWPQSTEYINYKTRQPFFWPEIIFWVLFFTGWQFGVRATLHYLGFQCATTAQGGPNAVEVFVHSMISHFGFLPASIIFMLSGQGFSRHVVLILISIVRLSLTLYRLQTARMEMARIRVSSLEIAHMLIKFSNPPLDAQAADYLPLII